MAEYTDREHFLPIHRSELIDVLAEDRGKLSGQPMLAEDRQKFRTFCEILSADFHFRYLKQLERLKEAYRPFDPDTDIPSLQTLDDAQKAKRQEQLFADFADLLERANYTKINLEEVVKSTDAATFWGLNMDLDFSVFERIDLYDRGDVQGVRYKPHWWDIFGLFKGKEVKLPMYQRLVAIVKMREHSRLGPDIDTKSIFLKFFKEIPKADLEMLLPGARVKMTKLDKALIFYPLATGVGMLLYKIISEITNFHPAVIAGAVGALASWTVLMAVGGYGYKSYYSFTVKKQSYTLRLTKSLYYQTLASNAGVLFRLLDEAEEQDCREAILAYYYLWRYAPPEGWTAEQLDDYIEMDLEARVNLKVDFEIGDALAKLEKMNLLERAGDRCKVPPIDRALVIIDETWDNYFQFNTGTAAQPQTA